jgi:AcrR family transcriptional regulator
LETESHNRPNSREQQIPLRDRKKLKTRLTIQQQAMRLFRTQGYNDTTVEQIAEAAEVSPSTFFRYFPTKESVVLTDFYDPIVIDLVLSQPPELSPLDALRKTVKEGYENMSAAERESEMERSRLIMSVPELRTAAMGNFLNVFQLMTDALSKRTGRPAGDGDIRMFAGAFFGIALAAGMIWLEDPSKDLIQLFDDGISYLGKGLPLARGE